MKLSELKKLAQKATPGPWFKDGTEIRHDYDSFATNEGISDCTIRVCETGDLNEGDAQFIAAANPNVVIQLVERVENLSEALKNSQKSIHNEFFSDDEEYWDLCSDPGSIISKYGADVDLE